MKKGRLEAFSDGVIAIIITIMVLELKVPHGDTVTALVPLFPIFISYLLSFIYLAIYWNNHHHMLQVVESVNGTILWANINLLFWLSLIPFVTGWMGENNFTTWPVAFYGFVLFMTAVSYTILARILVKHHGNNSTLSKAIGKDSKGKISLVLYFTAIIMAFINSWVSFGIYILVAIIWIVPDKRIEKRIGQGDM